MNEEDIVVFGQSDERTMEQARKCAETADYVALMADNHVGYAVPIGGVVAYRDAVSPSGVGFDIGCGNRAARLDVEADYVRNNISTIMDRVWSELSFGVGRKNAERVDIDFISDDDWASLPGPIRCLKDMAAAQLGTIGSGNHYVDIFTDEADQVWVGVHFGSRGFGHKIATHFLHAAGATDGMDVAPCVLDAQSDLGMSYIKAMEIAGKYAYAGRDWVCEKMADILGGTEQESVHNFHNFTWREKHFGEYYWVVRKGATPAFPGQKGFVGSNMVERSVILEGVDSKRSAQSMYSTVHGAGRVMGRMEAKGKYKNGVCVREPKIDEKQWRLQLKDSHVELRGAGLDEAPNCYKLLPEVLAAHLGTVQVLHTLKPIGVAMAGDEYDPYKD